MFYIRDIPIRGRVFLSPMAGFSDSPYRLLCRQMGSGFSFTEFVSTDGLVRGNPKTISMFRFEEAERPILFQIFGKDPEVIVRAAKIAESLGPDAIDLNMGCSVKKVALKGSGAGLLQDPLRTGRIVEQMVRALKVPVTAKIRLGWSHSTRNYLEMARILEESGASMVSVHGRTRDQAYHGTADWDAIGEVKTRLSIPVLGNGDVKSYGEAMEKISTYGVDGVLVGRAAMGNPWIFSGLSQDEIALPEMIRVALLHYEAMERFYGSFALKLFRKHAVKYLRGFPGATEVRNTLVTCEDPLEFRRILLGLLPGGALPCDEVYQ